MSHSNRLRTRLSLQQPSGFWTNGFAYDLVKRLTNVTSQAGSFGYLYDPALFTHHASRVALPNTSYITNVFDSNVRLLATYLRKSDNTVFDSYAYVYNPANQRTNLARADTSTVGYKYDRVGRLTVADSSVSTEDTGYTYDAGWNLHYRTNFGGLNTYSVDSKNQLSSSPGGSPSYDANSNLTALGDGTFDTAGYDDENRLIWAQVEGFWRSEFTYDGMGRLRQRSDFDWDDTWKLSEQVNYIYDGWRVIQERDSNNVPAVSYTRGNDFSGTMEGAGGIGGMLARSFYSLGGPFHDFYFADGNGNITCMLDSSQNIVASYRYDPFGNTISLSGLLAGANTYRFSSKELMGNSGLYYYGYRFYDPNLQRWVNRDPIEERGGLNLYRFAANAPINKVDSLGLDPYWGFSTETCCCNGKKVKNMAIKSGLKRCTGKANTVDTDHGWLEMDDGWSADFVAAGSIWWGHGVVSSPTDYVKHSDKQCDDVWIFPCSIDKDKFLKAVKERVAANMKKPPNYNWLLYNCFEWDNAVINDALRDSAGCTAK